MRPHSDATSIALDLRDELERIHSLASTAARLIESDGHCAATLARIIGTVAYDVEAADEPSAERRQLIRRKLTDVERQQRDLASLATELADAADEIGQLIHNARQELALLAPDEATV